MEADVGRWIAEEMGHLLGHERGKKNEYFVRPVHEGRPDGREMSG